MYVIILSFLIFYLPKGQLCLVYIERCWTLASCKINSMRSMRCNPGTSGNILLYPWLSDQWVIRPDTWCRFISRMWHAMILVYARLSEQWLIRRDAWWSVLSGTWPSIIVYLTPGNLIDKLSRQIRPVLPCLWPAIIFLDDWLSD